MIRQTYTTVPIRVGTRVKIPHSGVGHGTVVEFRGELGPNGARIYRLQVGRKRSPAFMEVREDQIEVVDEGAAPEQPPRPAVTPSGPPA